MTFYEELGELTAKEREFLLTAPLIEDALRGEITLEQYAAFLKEAYFHVKQTVPLLMGCGARLPARLEWLRKAVIEYLNEGAFGLRPETPKPGHPVFGGSC